jgi:hypothetical protein
MARTIPEIIAALGGLTKTADALGHRYPTKVQGWKERGRIPLHHVDAFVAIGQQLEPPVTREEILNASITAAIEGPPSKDAAA